MTFGTEHEHRLLDAILRDNRQAEIVTRRVTADEFSHPSVGAVFDGLCTAIGTGQHIDTLTVADHFVAWQAVGIGEADPFVWSKVDTIPADAAVYADRIRSTYLRSRGMELASRFVESLRDGATEPQHALTRLAERAADLAATASTAGLQTKSLSEILQTADTYDWVIPDMLERGDRLVITGGEGGGKTTFLRQIAIAAAGGIHPMTKQRIDPVRVLVVDAENTEKQWRRNCRWIVNQTLRLGASVNPAEAIHVHNARRMDLGRAGDMNEIHRLLDRHRPDLLLIGPLYKLVPRAITNDDDAAPLIAALDTIRERGVTLVMEAHAGKATDADGDRNMAPRGSSALLGWPEFGFGMRPMREDPTLVRLVRWRGDRDQREWPDVMYRGGDLPWTPSAV